MSDPLAPGGGDFLRNMLGDLLRLIRTEGPLQWELAFQLATSVAAGDEPDLNPDPIARIRLEELSAIAELHVSDVTGMALGCGGSSLKLVPTTRVEWARRSLEAWRPLLDRLASALTTTAGSASPGSGSGAPGPLGFKPVADASATGSEPGSRAPDAPEGDEDGMPVDPFLGDPYLFRGAEPADGADAGDADLAEMIGRWTSAMAPAMAAMQVGSVVGHLARRSLGQYDLPLPRTSSSEILVVLGNLDRVAEEWSLPTDDLRLWLCAHEMAFHAVLTRPHVARRLEDLVVAHVKLVRPDPRDFEGLLQGIDPGSIPGLSQIIGDPSLLGEADYGPSPELEKVRAQLASLDSRHRRLRGVRNLRRRLPFDRRPCTYRRGDAPTPRWTRRRRARRGVPVRPALGPRRRRPRRGFRPRRARAFRRARPGTTMARRGAPADAGRSRSPRALARPHQPRGRKDL